MTAGRARRVVLVTYGDRAADVWWEQSRGALERLDNLTVLVEMTENMFSDEIRRLEVLEHKIEAELASALSVSAKVRLVSPKTIERSEGKAKRVIDKRMI